MVAEIISTIIQVVKDISNHIDDYKCDDEIIDGIFHKIVTIQPHIENLNLINDTINCQNCQRLYVIICKIKKEIKDYKLKSAFKKFFSINDLKRKVLDFDNEIETIFKNLKLNLIIKNNKNSDDLINYKQEQMDILKQSLNAKSISNEFKKDLASDIISINNKLDTIIDYIRNNINITEYSDILQLLNTNILLFNDNFIKNNEILSNIDNNVNIIANNILSKKYTLYKVLFIILCFLSFVIYNLVNIDYRIYT